MYYRLECLFLFFLRAQIGGSRTSTAADWNSLVGPLSRCVNPYIHTAKYCNPLQHTATHCNTRQRTATHCNTLYYTATHGNTLQHRHTCCTLPRCKYDACSVVGTCTNESRHAPIRISHVKSLNAFWHTYKCNTSCTWVCDALLQSTLHVG